MASNEVERRGVAATTNEADLSESLVPSLAHRRRDPRFAPTPIARRQCHYEIHKIWCQSDLELEPYQRLNSQLPSPSNPATWYSWYVSTNAGATGNATKKRM